MDFLVEDPDVKDSLEDRINTAVEQLGPKNYRDLIIGYGRKVKDGPVYCFLEFYDVPVEPEEADVVSDRMRLQGD